MTAIPSHLKIAQELLMKKSQKLLTNYFTDKDSLMSYEEESILYTDTTKEKAYEVRAVVYLSEEKKIKEMKQIVQAIENIEQRVKEKEFDSVGNATEWLLVTAKKLINCWEVTCENKKLILSRNIEYLERLQESCGKMILITNRKDLSILELLNKYREKDTAEKAFDALKNDLHQNRMRTHSEETTMAKMFINFISLIINTHINKKLKENKSSKKSTVAEALHELDLIKRCKLNSQNSIIDVLTKKQKTLFAIFDITPPS